MAAWRYEYYLLQTRSQGPLSSGTFSKEEERGPWELGCMCSCWCYLSLIRSTYSCAIPPPFRGSLRKLHMHLWTFRDWTRQQVSKPPFYLSKVHVKRAPPALVHPPREILDNNQHSKIKFASPRGHAKLVSSIHQTSEVQSNCQCHFDIETIKQLRLVTNWWKILGMVQNKNKTVSRHLQWLLLIAIMVGFNQNSNVFHSSWPVQTDGEKQTVNCTKNNCRIITVKLGC